MHEHLRRGGGIEEELPGECPVRRAREGIEIGTPVDAALGEHLFRRHECRRARQQPLPRQQRRLVPGSRLVLDDAEIQHFQVVVLESEPGHEQVGRFDIPMHQAVFVHMRERGREIEANAHGFVRGQATTLFQVVAEGARHI